MNPTYDLTGQVALVTGASSGMGWPPPRLRRSGAAVVWPTSTTGGLVSCDVANEDQAAAMVERAVATFGRLDMAFNSSGLWRQPAQSARCGGRAWWRCSWDRIAWPSS